MKTGRADYDATMKNHAIPSDEPTFTVRAQDPDAADTVRDWAARAYHRGVDVAIIEQALQQADAMDAWPTKKKPGADHLSDAENNHLAYELGRRAWNAREDAEDPRVLLAEIRGHRAGINDCRTQLGFMADAASVTIAAMELETAGGQ